MQHIPLSTVAAFARGIVNSVETENGLRFERFDAETLAYYEKLGAGRYDRACCSAGVTLAFRTDSRQLALTLDLTTQVRAYSFADVCVDGLFVASAEPTGRPHQIRATLKAIGFPVVGDKLYGVDETIYARMCTDAMTPADVAALRMNRQALHAQALAFRHPFTKEQLAFEAPLPPDEPLWRIFQ